MTGMTVAEFNTLVEVVIGRLEEAERSRLNREGRKRAPGGGHPYGLSPQDRILLTILWLHRWATHEVLGFLFGVSKTTIARAIARIRPLLLNETTIARRGPSQADGSQSGSHASSKGRFSSRG
jgi:hypothetical protein